MKPANLFICLSLLFLATAGCHGYAFIETPTTDGFHSKLPSPYTRAVVWGGRPDTVQSASTWLLKKGVLVVDQTKVLQAAADQTTFAGTRFSWSLPSGTFFDADAGETLRYSALPRSTSR